MTSKDVEYYVSLPYRVEIYPEADGSGYTAVLPELPGCMTCADTLEELWGMVEEAKRGWLEASLEDGDYIPEPVPVEVEGYSGKFVVRIPTSLHCQLVKRAESEKTSLNQLVVMLLAEGMGRWSIQSRPSVVYPRFEQEFRPLERVVFEDLKRHIFQASSVKQPSQEHILNWRQQKKDSIQTGDLVA